MWYFYVHGEYTSFFNVIVAITGEEESSGRTVVTIGYEREHVRLFVFVFTLSECTRRIYRSPHSNDKKFGARENGFEIESEPLCIFHMIFKRFIT